jgi:PAS domain S-box-containing protein
MGLESVPHEVTVAVNGDEGLKSIQENVFDVVITDIIMPEKDGLEIIIYLRKFIPSTKIIAISGGGKIQASYYLETAKVLGASRVFEKPVDIDVIRDSIEELFDEDRAAHTVQIDAKELMNAFLDASSSAFYLLDSELNYIDSHAASSGWTVRFTREEIIGRNMADVVPESLESGRYEIYKNVIRTGKAIDMGEVPDPNNRVISRLAFPMSPNHLGIIATDVTERIRIEDALRESEEKYRTIIANMEEGYYEVDLAGNLTFFNDSFCKMVRYPREELMGLNNQDYMEKDTTSAIYEVFNKVYRTGIPARTPARKVIGKDGESRFIEGSVSLLADSDRKPIGFRGIIADITEHKRIEEKLLQAQKIEALGTFAGGIAHDFNNILHVISGYCKLAQANVNGNSELLAESLDQIEFGGRRASELVSQILTFSRTAKVELEPIDLPSVVKDNLQFIRSTIPIEIRVDSNLDTPLGHVLANSTQIHQVVVNLCTNAVHAMEDRGGLLTVALEPITLSAPRKTLSGTLDPGDYVAFAVGDTGKGIDAEVVDKLFDPFFTTKEAGKGTGLGLAMVHGIAKSMNAGLSIESELGRGTTVTLMFPVTREAPTPAESKISAVSTNGAKTVVPRN